MSDAQRAWFEKLVNGAPESWTSAQRTFMDDMASEWRQIEEARAARYEREYQAMLRERHRRIRQAWHVARSVGLIL